ncbi:epidermal retinol dehydrogenase 2 isoform X2 [Trichomycterus rosablanca]|uniref:epidermal retinol dehydrogenase 2 isoform X2 n=1 Tax=Trichomycterus rosablanca TaxID=2290929 RepID=UPI002F3518AE
MQTPHRQDLDRPTWGSNPGPSCCEATVLPGDDGVTFGEELGPNVVVLGTLVKREVGDVTILINNAGVVTGKKFLQCPDNLIEKTMEVNSLAHFWTYKAFLPAMIAANHGHVVSIASSAGLIGVSGLADYCASKFAAVGFAESMALELHALGCNGVKTTIVCPFFINTGMFEGANTKWPRLMPILEPDYVCRKIVDAVRRDQVYLYLPRSMYLTISLKHLLPVKLGMLLGEYLGAFDFMAKFKGHGKKNN